jgi:hypothetical protein
VIAAPELLGDKRTPASAGVLIFSPQLETGRNGDPRSRASYFFADSLQPEICSGDSGLEGGPKEVTAPI